MKRGKIEIYRDILEAISKYDKMHRIQAYANLSYAKAYKKWIPHLLSQGLIEKRLTRYYLTPKGTQLLNLLNECFMVLGIYKAKEN